MRIPVLFQGERMTCCMCGRSEQSEPTVENNWRAIQVEDAIFYVCPGELPPDGSTKEQYSTAYARVLKKILPQ